MGVSSLARYRPEFFGEPRAADSDKLFLMRSVKVMVHETGHMFGMEHCIAYECNMCGSNNREEADRRPIELCPECAPKVWWGIPVAPAARYESLAAFCATNGLADDAARYKALLDAVQAPPSR